MKEQELYFLEVEQNELISQREILDKKICDIALKIAMKKAEFEYEEE